MLYVDLWKMLIERGHRNAAYGLLCDAFAWLEISLLSGRANDPAVTQAVAQATLREELMEILQDPDGHKLREWFDIYLSDESKFLNRATTWIESCCDE